MRVVLDPGALAIANGVVGEKERRPILECVEIGNGMITSVDGFLLFTKPVEMAEGDGPILVKGRTLLEAKMLFPQSRCVMERVDDSVTLKSEHTREPDITITDKTQEGDFPRWDGLFPDGEPVAELALELKLIKKVLKVVGNKGIIRLRIRGNENKEDVRVARPVEFCVGEINGLIMPMCVESGGHWHKPRRGNL